MSTQWNREEPTGSKGDHGDLWGSWGVYRDIQGGPMGINEDLWELIFFLVCCFSFKT